MADNPVESKTEDVRPIQLSRLTEALLASLDSIKSKSRPDDISRITVSQTVSFFGIVYEKVRNAVEYREDHLIRRAAIERIMKRRIGLNPSGRGEAENLIRELLWARYFNNGSLGGEDVLNVQEILDKYTLIRRLCTTGRNLEDKQYIAQFLFELLTCEIEERLSPENSVRESSFSFFIYQVLRQKIKIEGLSEQDKDAYFLAAIEKAYRKSDISYERYHFFITFYKPIHEYSIAELENISTKLPEIFRKIDQMIKNPYVDNLVRYTRKQLPSFLVLFDIVKTKARQIKSILTDKSNLWKEVDITCRNKYQYVNSRVKVLAVRSFIYILLTKMVFALILEYPVSKMLYGEVNNLSIIINSLFPPILMAIIVLFFRMPSEDNTRKIYYRIINIIDRDKSFETQVAFMPKGKRQKKSILVFGFTMFYTLTFIITLSLIYEILSRFGFNLVSQAIFIFFVSVVTFFSYRVKQIVNEYRLEEKEGILSPVFDFFFMPVLALGKFFSSEIAKLNFFIVIFDFLIEAPFKFIFEIVEEWISFVRKRKEEII